jgi:hypothetical protein
MKQSIDQISLVDAAGLSLNLCSVEIPGWLEQAES